MGYRITPESFEGFVKSMRAVEDRIKLISSDDVDSLGQLAKGFIQDIFPKSLDRKTLFERGSHSPEDRGTPLYSGWRTYPTSTNGSIGFVLKHARMGQSRVATVLAALDQGSKAHTEQLQNAQAFRFLDTKHNILMRAGSKNMFKSIRIPARRPEPGPDGYISPTRAFIIEMMDFLADTARKDLEDSLTKKQLQYSRIKNLALAGKITKLASP
jgi:hypothetical protein